MLEVQSPVPLTEGESMVMGLSTKHLLHFMIGLAVSSPIMGVAFFVLPSLHMSKFVAVAIGAGVGSMFAFVPVKGRPMGSFLWLSIRYSRRAKVILYDREYRINYHRHHTLKGGKTE